MCAHPAKSLRDDGDKVTAIIDKNKSTHFNFEVFPSSDVNLTIPNATGIVLERYMIASGANESSDPLAWILHGAVNDSWVVLDSRSDFHFTDRHHPVWFAIPSKHAGRDYDKIKLQLSGGYTIGLAEFQVSSRNSRRKITKKRFETQKLRSHQNAHASESISARRTSVHEKLNEPEAHADKKTTLKSNSATKKRVHRDTTHHDRQQVAVGQHQRDAGGGNNMHDPTPNTHSTGHTVKQHQRLRTTRKSTPQRTVHHAKKH